MKNEKFILIIILVFHAFVTMGQEKGLYLTAGGGLGANYYHYNLDNNNTSVPKIGFNGNLGIQYFFTQHWGLSSGVGLSYYHSRGRYANSWDNDPQHYLFNGMYDDDFRYIFGDEYRDYALQLELNNWTEIQQGYFLEVPLMIMYQTKWGNSKSWGMYAGLGGKVQLPVISQTYSVKKGSELLVSAYYPKPDMTLPDPLGPDVSWHGYGTNSNIAYSGDMKMKTSFALSGKVGLLKTLTPRIDLMMGVYFDYGLNNIKDGNKTPEAYLINPENNAKTIQPSNYVGDHLQYNGYINSHPVQRVNLMALAGEVGIRIKLGKGEGKGRTANDGYAAPGKSLYNIQVLDSLTRKPLSTEVVMECIACFKSDKQTISSSENNTVVADLYPSNKYNAIITKTGFPPYNTQFITVAEKKEIVLLMPLRPSIWGTVKNNRQNELSDVSIKATDFTSRTYDTETNAEGYFIVPTVDAGAHYYIIAAKPGYIPDTIQLDIPADPGRLQPSYVVLKLDSSEITLKPIKKMTLSSNILFDLGKFDLRPDAKKEIEAIIPMLKENPTIQVIVEGNTDSRGSAEYNLVLSQKRANSVRDYMIAQGISAKRIKAIGYGFYHLKNKCKPGVKCSEAEHQENRIVNFIFTDKNN